MLTLIEFINLSEEDFHQIFESFGEIVLEKTQPWGQFKHDHKSGTSAHDQAHEFYKKHVEPHVEKSHKDFHRLLHRAKSHDAKVITSRKTPHSFVDKVVNRKKDASTVHDVVRGAILTRNHKETQDVVHKLKKHGEVTDIEHKKKGESEGGYHGAHHVSVKIHGVHHEVQIMPKKVWHAKQAAHHYYDKHRSSTEHSPERKKDYDHSKKLFARAVKRAGVHEESNPAPDGE